MCILKIYLLQITPLHGGSTAEELVKHDPYGIFLTIVSISIVITVLTLVYLTFKLLTKLLLRKKISHTSPEKVLVGNTKETEKVPMPSGELSAAISMALYLYKLELDAENKSILTINKITHRYSPWSSKIYGLRYFSK